MGLRMPGEGQTSFSGTDEPRGALERSLVDSYRKLARLFGHLLSEQSLDSLLEEVATALDGLVPYDSLTIYQADETTRLLTPVHARDQWAEEVLASSMPFGHGITGWAVEHRQPVLTNAAHLDPRASMVPGTPIEPEALITVPLISREKIKGALNLYRIGDDANFSTVELELARSFADAAALAIDNAEIREALEHQAQTDALTGLYNHRYFHERLKAELVRASRAGDTIALLVFDLDDFKRVNDIYGHGLGDHVLQTVGEVLQKLVRGSDIPCRIGGEEFAAILPSCDAGDALGLARRLADQLAVIDFDPAGRVSVSIGVAQGPQHAANPRELVACAEAAMMTAKSRGKARAVLFQEGETERPVGATRVDDVRSIAHLKMLQSLSGKLNRLNGVRQIGDAITSELRTLIDYHDCRVYLAEGDRLIPIAWRGELPDGYYPWEHIFMSGQGVVGRTLETGQAQLIPDIFNCEFADIPEENSRGPRSIVSVPLTFGVRVVGVLALSKLGVGQFDADDVRLLEVLAGHASVALENARMYEEQRRDAERARSLLEFADRAAKAESFHEIGNETANMAQRLLDVDQAALWIQDERSGEFRCSAHSGFVGDPRSEQVIRMRIPQAEGESLLEHLSGPTFMTPEEVEEFLTLNAPLRPSALAPLNSANGLFGWIVAREPQARPGHFSEERLRLFASLASHASVAMQKSLVYRDQKETAEIAQALLEFGSELARVEGLDEVLERSVEMAARQLGAPHTSIWLQHKAGGDLLAATTHGFNEHERATLEATVLDGALANKYLARDFPFVMHAQDAERIGIDPGVARASLAVAPMRLEGSRHAAIAVAAPALGEYEFSERKMRLLAGIANQLQLAINNALGFDNMEQTFLDTVEALANALEAKDEYTSDHARWITDTALLVGTKLGMDTPSLKRLELGALFHDIGKIGIPTDILRKPGPLNDEEWEIIRTHPELGERILAPIARLADVRPIVRACHEHWDGQGYPDKKLGDDIPLESRIILVVDAFHAMTSDRPYRKALPLEVALDRLAQGAGQEFDPTVVDTFIEVLDVHPELASAH